jgi:hypothetical protein
MSRQSLLRTAFAFLLILLTRQPACVWAGGGPENVLLVVNPKSPASLCIANHYISLRDIPDDNVLLLPWDPKADTTDVATFRKQILLPILRTISNRHLGDQIDMVVYSSDFPWGISLDGDVEKFMAEVTKLVEAQRPSSGTKPDQKKPPNPVQWPQQFTKVGSLNGLTYLWQPVVAEKPDYFLFKSNHYMPQPILEQRDARTVGFRGNRQYNVRGEVVASGGRRYFLSTMLGVTAGRGNSLAEVLAYLRRSAAADGTHPTGTIYFMRSDDIRSKKREEGCPFSEAVSALSSLGVKAEILQGTVPLKKSDVQGVVMGTVLFDWKASGSTILPGAICENFTSFGGVMRSDAGQTPLSEFLRNGAAGSSGTVVEPYAFAEKFPSPMIQVHYARGCSLAEAFYQSVHGPYQLLIVGDPLCRPWANIPRVSIAGVKAGATVRGRLTLEPAVASVGKAAARQFELFVDGVRTATCERGRTLALDTVTLPDGYHELRVVAIGPPPIETQGRRIIAIRTANHDRKIEASLVGQGPWRADRPLEIAVRSPGSLAVAAMHGTNVVGRTSSEEGTLTIPANSLGAGPVRIRVVGLGDGGSITNVAADPIQINLE